MSTHRLRHAALLSLLALGLGAGRLVAQEQMTVRTTWYLPTGNPMANGQMPYHGAAACSWNLALGTRLRLPDGMEVVCADRGQLGNAGWLDIFAPTAEMGRDIARRYGNYTTVEVVR